MHNFEIIGKIPNHHELFNWCEAQFNDGQPIGNSYSNLVYRADDRWFNWKSNLQGITPDKRGLYLHRITKSPGDNRLNDLGNKLLPGFHSALLRRYRPPLKHKGTSLVGGYIKWHADHGIFEGWLAMVNIGAPGQLLLAATKDQSPFSEQRYYQKIDLKPGHAICFNSKYAHRSLSAQSVRYSLTFRKFKPGWEKWIPGSDFLLKVSPGTQQTNITP